MLSLKNSLARFITKITTKPTKDPDMSTSDSHIHAAYWIGPGQCCVLLRKNWKKNNRPPIRLSGEGLKLKNLRPMEAEEIGRFTGYFEQGDRIIFCLNPDRFPHIDFDRDPVRVAGPFNDWGRSEDAAAFNLSRTNTTSQQPLYQVSVPRARVVAAGKRMTFKFVSTSWHWLTPLRCAPNLIEDRSGNLNYGLNVSRSGQHAFVFDLKNGRGLDRVAHISWGDEEPTLIKPGLFFFDLKSDAPCGACVENNDTYFRLFAPRATRVAVEFDRNIDFSQPRRVDLQLAEDQVTWEAKIPENLHGQYYRLFVDGPNDGQTTLFDYSRPLLDPWARATTGPEGPGIIIDPTRTQPRGPAFVASEWKDLTILECHVRDLVQKAPARLTNQERLGFSGVTKFVRQKKNYLRTLGVNALEFQPIQQFDSKSQADYHWGYMTNNFFAPCAWYGSNPENGSQNEEFGEMVTACHEAKLSVIIDVVYNHLGEPPNLLFIDKAYYFHLNEEGYLMNWSGCGNVLRAESAMSTRLIIESLSHLVQAYDVDGFRFDLAELIGIEVLKLIKNELERIKPSIVLIAEPWSFRGSIQWDTRMAGFAFWNDGFREFTREYVRGHSNPGALAYYVKGCTDQMTAWPAQSINYVESHDDRTWIDDITENGESNGTHPTQNDILRSHMMAALLYTSLGVPMLSSGQDYLRSKGGIHNTYQMGDVNALDYTRIEAFQQTHAYFKKWIEFRSSDWGKILRLRESPETGYLRVFTSENNHSSATALLFNADRKLGKKQILLALNPHFEDCRIHLYDIDGEGWLPVADIWNFEMKGLADQRMNKKHRDLHLGHLTLGLWIRD